MRCDSDTTRRRYDSDAAVGGLDNDRAERHEMSSRLYPYSLWQKFEKVGWSVHTVKAKISYLPGVAAQKVVARSQKCMYKMIYYHNKTFCLICHLCRFYTILYDNATPSFHYQQRVFV